MNARVLAFPVAVAAIAALDGCNALDAIGPHPAVRLCHNDTTYIPVTYRGVVVDSAMVIYWERNPGHCRAA